MTTVTRSTTNAPVAPENKIVPPKVDNDAVLKLLRNAGVTADKLNGFGVQRRYIGGKAQFVYCIDALAGPGAKAIAATIERIMARPDAQELTAGLPVRIGIRAVAIAQST